MGMLPGATSLD